MIPASPTKKNKAAVKLGRKGGEAKAAKIREWHRLEAEGDPEAIRELERMRETIRRNRARRWAHRAKPGAPREG